MDIPIGLPCSNEAVCEAISWGILLIVALAVVLFVRKLWLEWKKDR